MNIVTELIVAEAVIHIWEKN